MTPHCFVRVNSQGVEMKFCSLPVQLRLNSKVVTFCRPLLSLLAMAFFAAPELAAEAPAITSIFPPGLQRGSTAEFKLTGKPGTQPVSVVASSDALGEFKLSEKGDQLTLTASADAQPGLHWLRFHNAEGATSQLPILVGVLPEITEKEPNNSATEAEKIESLPILINGVLHRGGEVDTFAVTLADGETLVASVDAHAAFESPMDSVLQILDADGYVIEQNDDDHGNDSLIAFQAPHQGTFLVRIFCFPATPNSTINFAGGATYHYRLTLTSGPFITARTVTSGKPLGWNLDKADPKQLESGTASEFHQIHQRIAKQNPSTEADAVKAVQTIPFAVSGVIEKPEELDVFRFTGKKGDSLQLRVQARAIGSHLDPVLKIRDSQGKVLKEFDDVSRSDQDINDNWKVPADGEFQLEVSDRFNHAGFRYVYLLTAELNTPGADLTVTVDHFEAKRDKPIEIPVAINRLHGFDKELLVSVKNLPEGATAEAVKSEAKGDSAKKVTLKIDVTNAAGFQGPIEIVGNFGDEKTEVIATSPLQVTPLTTSDLWLTIPAKPEEKPAEKDK